MFFFHLYNTFSVDSRVALLFILATMTTHCKPLRNPVELHLKNSTKLNERNSVGQISSTSKHFLGQNDTNEKNTTNTMVVPYPLEVKETTSITFPKFAMARSNRIAVTSNRVMHMLSGKSLRHNRQRSVSKGTLSLDNAFRRKHRMARFLSQAKASAFQALRNFVSCLYYIKVLRPSCPNYWKMLNGYLMFSVKNIVQNFKLFELWGKNLAPLHFVISKS